MAGSPHLCLRTLCLLLSFVADSVLGSNAANTTSGPSIPAQRECPAGQLSFVSETYESHVLEYNRKGGQDVTDYLTKSVDGYCKVLITLGSCAHCAHHPNIETLFEFNHKSSDVVKTDEVLITFVSGLLYVQFRFKQWKPFLSRIEEKAKNLTKKNEIEKTTNLLKHLKYAYKEGYTLDPPRSLISDYDYAPDLIAPPNISAGTTPHSMTGSSSADESPNSSRSRLPSNINGNDAGQESSGTCKESSSNNVYLYTAIAFFFTTTCASLIWAIIERRMRMKMGLRTIENEESKNEKKDQTSQQQKPEPPASK